MTTSKEVPQFSDVLSIPSNPEDLFTLLYPIGTGGFGKVYKAMHNSTNQIFAIKIIDYTKDCISNKKNISFNYQSIQQETSVMRLIQKNDYIVKYYGSYYSRKSNTVWLILEYCGCGSAVDLMLAMDRTLSEIEVSTIIQMILKGLINIHEINLIHRDVKGSNILLSEDGYAKLGDFGVGIQLTDEEYRTSKKGSPYWMSPQVVLNEKYDTKTDIWSLGITCVELVEGEPPNSELKPGKVMEKIAATPPKVEDIIDVNEHTDEFIDFVKLCLEIDPSKRPTAKELIKHPFITKLARGREYLAELIKNNIEDVERYRSEEIEKENNKNQSEIDNDNNNENNTFNNKNSQNNKSSNNLSESNNEKSLGNINNREKNNNNYSKDSKYIKKSLSDFEPVDNNSVNNIDNGSVIINESKKNSLNLGEPNDSMIINDKDIINNNNNEDNNSFNSVIIADSKNENIIEENKEGDEDKPAFMKFIEDDNFDWDDEGYLENMKKRQLEEILEKRKILEEKKRKKLEEEKRNEKDNKLESNEPIINTPNKNNNNIKATNIKNDNNNEIILNKYYYTDLKINQYDNNLLIKEERENKEDNEEQYNNQNHRGCITSNFTQANSKLDSNESKNNLNSGKNNIFDNKKKNNNKYNYAPLKMKLKFNEDEKEQDTSNIDESENEEKINPIKKCLVNINYEDNKLEKSFDDNKNYYIRTEVKKKNRTKFLEKIKLSENIYTNIYNYNNNEDSIKNIHISSFKPHKNYFN